ncbi:MAG: hypothetical protein K6F37_02880 [Lachnospiraceae bacterium]|nr:hypothetical protein [Lachnospiraceae bacterium]
MNKEEFIKLIRESNESQMYPEDMFDFSASKTSPEEKREVMAEINHLRLNCLKVLHIDESDRILLVGETPAVVEEYLKRRAGSVDDTESEKKFTKIICLGTFSEYAAGHYEKTIKQFKHLLEDDGELVIAIPNQFGLKYFRGNREELTSGYFIGIEGYKDYDKKTFSRKKIKKLLKRNGFEDISFYYPYPDYRYATDIFSDEHLPKVGELANHFEGTELQHLMLFNETSAWDGIIEAGLFKEYSNSFLIIAKKEKQNKVKSNKESEKSVGAKDESLVYARFSNDRALDKGISTVVTVDKDANPHVYKLSDSKESGGHIKCIESSFGLLTKIYSENSRKKEKDDNKLPLISINGYSNANDKSCMLTGGKNEVIELDFVDGKTLEDCFDRVLPTGDKLDNEGKAQDTDEFIKLAKLYAKVIRSAADAKQFEYTEEFERVFDLMNVKSDDTNGDLAHKVNDEESYDEAKGEIIKIFSHGLATSVADIDMIPANIVVSGNEWIIMDYEWTFSFPIPLNFIIYRGIHYYIAKDAAARASVPSDIYEILGITEEEIKLYEKMEVGFQKYVVGGHKPLSKTAGEMIGKPSLSIDNVVLHTEAQVMRQFYSIEQDVGEGFVKGSAPVHENVQVASNLVVDDELMKDPSGRRTKNIKFNIWNYDSSLIEIIRLEFVLDDGNVIDALKYMTCSAYPLENGVYYFDHSLPCLYLLDIPENVVRLRAEIKIIETDETIKNALVPRILWKRGLKRAILRKLGLLKD